MTPLIQHIEAVRQKPMHIRKQIALGVAGALTAIIALVWLGTSLATGAFALKSSSFAEATSGVAATTQTASSWGGFSRFMGAVGAAFGGGDTGPAHIEVVGEEAARTIQGVKQDAPEPTVLPF